MLMPLRDVYAAVAPAPRSAATIYAMRTLAATPAGGGGIQGAWGRCGGRGCVKGWAGAGAGARGQCVGKGPGAQWGWGWGRGVVLAHRP